MISQHNLGSGQVILISDPSLFINGMKSIESNDDFIRNIAASTTTLYIDQSHLPPSDLPRVKKLLKQIRAFVANPLVTSGLVILVLIGILKPIWHKKQEDSKEA